MTRARAQTAPRVALAADDDRTAAEVTRVAAERGLPVDRLGIEAAIGAPVGAIAYVRATAPDAAHAAALARLCAAAAENRRPVVLLTAFPRVRGRAADERAIVLAYLRAHGAILVEDPDAWFEAAVLMAAYGPPAGPRLAVVAPPGGWLAAQATALAAEDEGRGGGRLLYGGDDQVPADVVLVDGGLETPTPERVGRAIVVPVVARSELLTGDGRTTLVGLRAAMWAAGVVGRHAERMTQGLGAAPAADARRLKVDKARADKALAAASGEKLGDHETKLLLSAYGVPVTRQAVAATPSAAVRYAQTLGWPVEIKAWDPATPGERDAPVVVVATNPPEVRRASAAAAAAAGLSVGVPVIVRATPAPGRELSARVERHSALGWMVLARVPGAGVREPLAAPAPLRRADADEIASALESSRAGDAPPDRAALAELLIRASFAVLHAEDRVEALELGRVVVGAKGEGALLVDARLELKKRR